LRVRCVRGRGRRAAGGAQLRGVRAPGGKVVTGTALGAGGLHGIALHI
jgi:hypothetical protein